MMEICGPTLRTSFHFALPSKRKISDMSDKTVKHKNQAGAALTVFSGFSPSRLFEVSDNFGVPLPAVSASNSSKR